MIVIGLVLVATPLAELAVQLTYGERPQILFPGGFCLIGILTVSHATRSRSAPGEKCREPAPLSCYRHVAGDALWLPERESR